MAALAASADGEHQPVMLDEVLCALAPRPEGHYLDATFGRGGHARALLARLGPCGRLTVADRDPEAIAVAKAWAAVEPRLEVRHSSFAELAPAADSLDGVLLDLGVSSPQLDTPARGFSFQADGPLDMRMDPGSGEPLVAWLARVDEQGLAAVLREFGEERKARSIARRIVSEREAGRLPKTTLELAALIAAVVGRGEPGRHPATRSFQALRIQINDELGQIERALPRLAAGLRPGGRMAVISFHSLEDRVVKRYLREQSRPPAGSRRLPPAAQPFVPRLRPLGAAQRPSPAEIARNPRARSAVLRVAEKCA